MTRKELVLGLAQRMNLKPEDALRYVETFMEVVLDALGSGDRIEIRGFGVFQIQERKAHKTRNPKSGEAVMVETRRTVKFKTGKLLQERVREAGFKATPSTSKKK